MTNIDNDDDDDKSIDDDGDDDDDDHIFVTNILPADGGGDKEGKGNSPQTQASPLKKPQL